MTGLSGSHWQHIGVICLQDSAFVMHRQGQSSKTASPVPSFQRPLNTVQFPQSMYGEVTTWQGQFSLLSAFSLVVASPSFFSSFGLADLRVSTQIRESLNAHGWSVRPSSIEKSWQLGPSSPTLFLAAGHRETQLLLGAG
jgi:hypothetical protein